MKIMTWKLSQRISVRDVKHQNNFKVMRLKVKVTDNKISKYVKSNNLRRKRDKNMKLMSKSRLLNLQTSLDFQGYWGSGKGHSDKNVKIPISWKGK